MRTSRLRFPLPSKLVLLAALSACGKGASPGDAGSAEQPGATVAPDRSGDGEIDLEELERLSALGYVEVADPLAPGAKTGVLLFDRARSAPGLNLITSSHFCSTELRDMEGNLLHSWSLGPCSRWGNAVTTPAGDLLVVGRVPHGDGPQEESDARYLARLAWNGETRWKVSLPVHHDVELTPDGRILSLTYGHRIIPEIHPSVATRDHALVLFSAAGELIEELSLWDVFGATDRFELVIPEPRLRAGEPEIDVFHANAIEWMRRPELEARDPIYASGSVLVCIRNQDTVAIIDWETRELLWTWGRGELSRPHDATLLDNGNVLVFDNGLGRGWSRVVEVDPLTRRIVWQYKADDPGTFFSGTRGANQRLSNGNTLITESAKGHVFEVTPAGEMVWEYLNPNLTEKLEPSVIVRTRRLEGLSAAELERGMGSGATTLPWVD